MDRLNQVQSNMLSLVKKFTQRQSIVFDAMRDLRPDLVMRYYDKTGTPAQWAELRGKYAKRPQTGYWGENSDWAYLLHGPGCRLTNVETKEVIEWDIGDLSRFNIDWFIKYLESLFKHEPDDESSVIRSVLTYIEQTQSMSEDELDKQRYKWKKQIKSILEQLCALGFLSKGSSYTYIVT
jgi:hypothetical protein